MASKPNPEFGKRRPATPPRPGPPVKRSNHVALLVMGSLAVGGGAYALMPRDNCQPASPAASAVPQQGADCTHRSSSSGYTGHGGGYYSRSSFFSGDSSSGGGSSSASSSGSVSRGGFGSFAHAFGFGGG